MLVQVAHFLYYHNLHILGNILLGRVSGAYGSTATYSDPATGKDFENDYDVVFQTTTAATAYNLPFYDSFISTSNLLSAWNGNGENSGGGSGGGGRQDTIHGAAWFPHRYDRYKQCKII